MGLRNVFSLPGLTLMACVEAFMLIKVFPDFNGTLGHLPLVSGALLLNYLLGLIIWGFLYPAFLSPLRHLPGPKAILNLSHRALLVENRPSGDLYLDIVKQWPGQDLVNLNFRRTLLLASSARALADILVHRPYSFTKTKNARELLRIALGDGLIIVEGDRHRFLRKNTLPAFGFRHIRDLYPMMWSKSKLLVKALREETTRPDPDAQRGPGVIELSDWASKVTLDIIGIAGLGRQLNAVEKKQDALTNIYEQLLNPTREMLIFVAACFTLGYEKVKLLPWKMNTLVSGLTNSLDEICLNMVRDKREAILKKGDDHFDILSLLIKSNNFSDTDLKDQLLTFLAAGHETTASALTWACYLLAKHPEIQASLRQEVRDALPVDPSEDPTLDLGALLEQLPLCNGVINETLRLYPTVPQTVREAQTDTRVADQPIPAGTAIVLSMWMINRSPDIWGDDAGEFRPERWISEAGKPNQNGGRDSNYDFLTFLHGPRSCIGQSFARAEMRCLVAALVQSFSWELAMDDKDVLPKGIITIRPVNGMYLRMRSLDT